MVLKYFFTYVRTQSNICVKSIRTDNGTEFVNTQCSNLFNSLDIIHKKSCLCALQQNGIAEKQYRHVQEVTRAIRFQANILLKFWGHCIKATVYLINMLPSIVKGLSPYEKL